MRRGPAAEGVVEDWILELREAARIKHKLIATMKARGHSQSRRFHNASLA